MNKSAALLCLVLALSLPIHAQDNLALATTFEGSFDSETGLSNLAEIDFGFTSGQFDLSAVLFINNDGKYLPLESNQAGGTFFDYYAFMKSGGIAWRPDPAISLKFGRLEHRDQLDGPYSLFVSSAAPSALMGQLRYENDYFFYESRWVELNSRSSMYTEAYYKEPNYLNPLDPDSGPLHLNDPLGESNGPFPDRGANVKAYGFKFGNGMRFGFQDAAIYTGRSFDFEYLINPIPQYFIQYVKKTDGRPWATGDNENNLIGAFWDWQVNDRLKLDAQFLMDDFNVYFLGIGKWNPWKAAWAASAKVGTDVGTFGFYHAGALKYTFQPTRDNMDEAYSYTYYPDSRFKIGSEYAAIPLSDLMFGYKHGENNIAFMADYSGQVLGMDLYSSLEFVLSGSKSPTNAWHDATWHNYDGSHLLDESVLEKLFLLSASAKKRLGNFYLYGNLALGVAVNALELVQPTPVVDSRGKLGDKAINKYSYIWKPGDDTRLIYGVSFGARYNIPVMGLFSK